VQDLEERRPQWLENVLAVALNVGIFQTAAKGKYENICSFTIWRKADSIGQ
jgi:hypothetical protein